MRRPYGAGVCAVSRARAAVREMAAGLRNGGASAKWRNGGGPRWWRRVGGMAASLRGRTASKQGWAENPQGRLRNPGVGGECAAKSAGRGFDPRGRPARALLLDSPPGLTYLRRPPAPLPSGTAALMWGHSSAGRALAWHARGRRFDPAWLHHPKLLLLKPAQPLGSTIGRSRSSSTQSPFSISASRPSSRKSAMSA